VDQWQVSDPTASCFGHFIPGKRFPSKHSTVSSIKLVLTSQARLIKLIQKFEKKGDLKSVSMLCLKKM
jgi:hypothetical protein